MPRKKPSGPPPRQATPNRPAIVLRLGPNDYAVAVWRGEENGEPVYEIIHEDIRDVTVAATLAWAPVPPRTRS